MVFLVTQQNVVHQRALAWQERTCNFKCFCMPELALLLSLFLHLRLQIIRSRLQKETHFSAHAKVGDRNNRKLLQKVVPRQLHLIPILLQKLFHLKWLNLHNVSNVHIENPFVLVQKTKHRSHVRFLVFLFFLFIANLEQIVFLFGFLRRCSGKLASDFSDYWVKLECRSLNKRNWLFQEVFRDFFSWRWFQNHLNDLRAFIVLQITLLVGCLQVFAEINLVDVQLTKLLQIFEEMVRQSNRFPGVVQSFGMVLSLTQNGAQLQF